MRLPKYRLYRKKIMPEDRMNHFYREENGSHLISIEVIISGDKWQSYIIPIFPAQLKQATELLLSDIIDAQNKNKKVISSPELRELGFREVQPRCIEEDFYYDWMEIRKNDSNLSITHEFTLKGQFLTQIVDFNGETLRGEAVSLEDLKLLIKLM